MKKCCFGVKKLEYLGHIITPDGVTVDPEKTNAVENCA